MSQKSERIAVIEQLRGIASLSVCWFHLTNQYGDWVSRTGALGWLGVEAFFVISGFVIPLSLALDWKTFGARAVPGFLARRLIRIEPPYLISILLVVGLNALAALSPLFAGQAPTVPNAQILLHAAYLIPFTEYEWLQPVYWTLAFEFLFYLVVGLCIPLFVSRRAGLLGWCYVVFLGVIAGGFVSPLFALFGMGLLVFRAREDLDRPGLATLGIALTAAAMVPGGAVAQAIVGSLTACIILLQRCSQGVPGLVGRVLDNLGKISFSLYLLHVPVGGKVVNLGQRWLTSPEEHFALSAIALGTSLLAAAFFWRLVEQPCLKAAAALRARQRLAGPDQAVV